MTDDFSELVDAEFSRVDLVGKAANGVGRFLIAKGAFSPDEIDGILKAETSTKTVNDHPDSDFAYIEPGGTKDESGKTTPRSLRHFPIHDAAHVRNALSRASSSPFGEKAMPKINAAAKKFGVEVSKASTPDIEPDDLNADGDVLVGSDDNTPGSQSWETVDADTAMKWLGILARAQHAVEVLRDRELAEADIEGDYNDVDALCNAACAIEIAIEFLAPFAVGEAAEAAFADEDPAEYGVFKTAASLIDDPFPLTTIENMIPRLKMGHKTDVAKAAADLLAVLSTLPAAPKEKVLKMTEEIKKSGDVGPQDDVSREMQQDGQSSMSSVPHVTEGADAPNQLGYVVTPADNNVPIPSDVTTLSGLAGSQDDIKGTDVMVGDAVVDQGVVTKAAPQQAVYDSNGKLLGTVDPSKITELVGEGTKDAATTAEGGADGTPAPEAEAAPAEKAPEEAAPAAPPADMEPAPAASVGTPAEGVVKAEDISEIVKAAVAEATSSFDAVVKGLHDEIEVLKAPARTRVLSHGALPPAHMLRGMDKAEGGSVDIAKAEDLRSQLETAQSMEQREAIEKQMNENAIAEWQALRAGR